MTKTELLKALKGATRWLTEKRSDGILVNFKYGAKAIRLKLTPLVLKVCGG